MKFIEGEEVLAKQPNTSEFQKGKVLNVKGSNYRIQFKGGSQFMIKEGDIKVNSKHIVFKDKFHFTYIKLLFIKNI